MTAIPKNARETLREMSRIKHKVIKKRMDENMQRLLAECVTNEQRAKLWEVHPMTGKRLSNVCSNGGRRA